MGALDEYGEAIYAASQKAGIPFTIVHEDGQYLYQLPNGELLTPGEMCDMLGIVPPWSHAA